MFGGIPDGAIVDVGAFEDAPPVRVAVPEATLQALQPGVPGMASDSTAKASLATIEALTSDELQVKMQILDSKAHPRDGEIEEDEMLRIARERCVIRRELRKRRLKRELAELEDPNSDDGEFYY